MANTSVFQQILQSSEVPREWLEQQLSQYSQDKNIDLDSASLEDLRKILSHFLQDSILDIQNTYS